ncbi:MAG: hypothetical protein SGJ24_00915, partial [Chloroflexota bacterium]|nr:hypothetical protein [Chloroflexota bacterium]
RAAARDWLHRPSLKRLGDRVDRHFSGQLNHRARGRTTMRPYNGGRIVMRPYDNARISISGQSHQKTAEICARVPQLSECVFRLKLSAEHRM